MKPNYKYIEHTADVIFVAEAPSLGELFEQSALATEEVMINLKQIAPKKKITIKLKNKSIENLLFAFLGELIFYKDAEQLLLSQFKVKIEQKKEEYVLNCIASGERLNPKKHEQKVDIKAITLHMFEVKQVAGGWRAQVLVDI